MPTKMLKNFSEKQIKILDVAEELIAKQGFDGTSVREIASKASINVAMISYYFGSKEKMLSYLYQYRVLKSRENLAEFTHLIKDGRPEMQMKEIIKFIIGQMFKYRYFHGFVKQELRHTDLVQDELLEFYKITVKNIDEVIKKGIAVGVFHHAPKAEDVLTLIIGPALFVIRNQSFYKNYLPDQSEEMYLILAEEKLRNNAYQSIFSLLGFHLSN